MDHKPECPAVLPQRLNEFVRWTAAAPTDPLSRPAGQHTHAACVSCGLQTCKQCGRIPAEALSCHLPPLLRFCCCRACRSRLTRAWCGRAAIPSAWWCSASAASSTRHSREGRQVRPPRPLASSCPQPSPSACMGGTRLCSLGAHRRRWNGGGLHAAEQRSRRCKRRFEPLLEGPGRRPCRSLRSLRCWQAWRVRPTSPGPTRTCTRTHMHREPPSPAASCACSSMPWPALLAIRTGHTAWFAAGGGGGRLGDKDAHELWNSSQMECRPFKVG